MKRVLRVVTPLLLLGASVVVGQDYGGSSSRRSDRDRSSSSDRERSSDRYSSDRSSRRDRSSSSSDRSTSNRGSAVIQTEGGPTSRPVTFLDAYRIVLDRNIFSRNRVAYRDPSESTRPTTQTSSGGRTEPALRLTGVTMEPGKIATASVEDARVSRATLYKVGDTFLDGKVTAIRLDGMEYTKADGAVVKIDTGSVVEGGPTHVVSSGPSSSSGGFGTGGTFGSSSSSGTTSSPPTPGEANDILERLRQRRLQETKR